MNRKEVEALIKESEEFIGSMINRKYCHKNKGEETWADIVFRFKTGLEEDEQIWKPKSGDYPELDREIPRLMKEKKVIAAGSILFGYRYSGNVSLSNCYFIPIEQDSIEGIFEFMKKQARTYSWRGGVGTDISILRPKDTPVHNAALSSSGSVSFMPLLSETTNTIGQNGRRGAHIITEWDWHPDIMNFIKCKSKPEEVFDYDFINDYLPHVYYANISVKLSDDFFKAVQEDKNWKFIFPDTSYKNYDKEWDGDIRAWKKAGKPIREYGKIRARDMLKEIAESAWKGAEPGVLYWDNVLNGTPLSALPGYEPRGVNPCGEQILSSWGNCLLVAVNLSKYVKDPYTEDAELLEEELLKDLRSVYAFADYIIDINQHPLPEQNKTDKELRKVGLEFTGLADMLAMLGLIYGSDESIALLDDLFGKINRRLIEYNVEFAEIKGCAPVFNTKTNRKRFLAHPFMKRAFKGMDKETAKNLKERIMEYGLRNSAWLNNGPTGSVSIIADNCSSGIEPVFQLVYKRKSRLLDKEVTIVHLPLLKYLAENAPQDLDLPKDKLKEKYHYVEAEDVDYRARVRVQAVLQKHFTDSISSTTNLPADVTPEQIYDLYLYGWQQGLKGITVFRSGSMQGVLEKVDEANNDNNKDEVEKFESYAYSALSEIPLLDEEVGRRYIIRWKGAKVYTIVIHDEDTGMPIEIFAQLPIEAGMDSNGMFRQELYIESLGYWQLITRLLSLCFRRGVPLEEVKKQLRKCSFSIAHLPAQIARILNKYPLLEEAVIPDEELELDDSVEEAGQKCPVCGEMKLVREAGCEKCLACGYSKCE